MKATIRDVAKLANVSPATVSRVLSSQTKVKEEKKQRVDWAIKQLNFTPNVVAQGLSRKTMNTIGIVATRSTALAFSNPYFSEVIRGIGRIAEQENYNLLLNTYSDKEKEKDECFKLLRSGRVDGLILLSSRVYDVLINELMQQNHKFVLIGRVIENTMPNHQNVHWVNTDCIAGAKLVVEHLIGLGHRKIAIINAPADYVVSQDRFMGYRQALNTNGIEYDEMLNVNGGYTMEDSRRTALKLLTENKGITAIFATDDLKAVAAIKVAQELGYRVPEDIAVVGHNDFDVATIITPSITTVRVPIYNLGEQAAKMLIDQINGDKIEDKHINLPIELVIRQSSGKEI